MTGLAAVLVLNGAVGSFGHLPLEDPLAGWLFDLETAGVVELGGVLPDGFDPAAAGAGGAWSAPLSRLRAASAPASTGIFSAGGSAVSAGGLFVLQGVGSSDGGDFRAGTSLDLQGLIAGGVEVFERVSIWAGSDELAPDGFAAWHEGEEEGRHFYVDRGFVSVHGGSLRGDFGRVPQRWGPGRFTSLLLSADSPSLDMLRVRWTPSRSLEFTGFTSVVESDSATWLTAHRLDIRPCGWARLGLSEAILFRSEGPELAYMNPVIPWYPVQWNEREDDNALLAFDATVVPARGLCCWAELLVDDFQYQDEVHRPDKLGYTVGAGAASPSRPVGCAAEYTRIDRYVYSQKLPRNFYLHDGRIIGSELGPDADRLTLEVSASPSPGLLATVGGEHERHGEGTVFEGWPDSFPEGDAPFPSGTVEHTTRARAALAARLLPWLELRGDGAVTWTRNEGHVHGMSGDGVEGSISAVLEW